MAVAPLPRMTMPPPRARHAPLGFALILLP